MMSQKYEGISMPKEIKIKRDFLRKLAKETKKVTNIVMKSNQFYVLPPLFESSFFFWSKILEIK